MIKRFADRVSSFTDQERKTDQKLTGSPKEQIEPIHRAIGPLGTALRLVLGAFLVGIIAYGQLTHPGHPVLFSWLLGVLGFPALVLAWHIWRIRRSKARFIDDSPLNFVLSLALPLAVYISGLVVPAIWFTSDAILLFIGVSLVLAALRGSAGCEFLAVSNLLLHRADQIACAVFTPIDGLDRHRV